MAGVLQHGTTHNAGIGHNNDLPLNKSNKTGVENVPDLTTGAKYYEPKYNAIKYLENIKIAGSKLKDLYYSKKFTREKAKDNVFDKKIE